MKILTRNFDQKFLLEIFNRAGQKIFSTSNINNGWDGTFSGQEENAGVFVYTVDYTFNSGEQGTIQGNITLVR